jgi:tetratricopeptide (TPR) repeat protein
VLKKIILFSISILLVNSILLGQSPCDSTAFSDALEFHQNSRFKEAIKKYSKQIKTCAMTEAYINRGVCYNSINDTKNAEKDFDDAIKISSDKLATRVQIGDYYFKLKNTLKPTNSTKILLK